MVRGFETVSIRTNFHRTESLGEEKSLPSEPGRDPGLSGEDPPLDRLPEDRPL